MLTNFSFKSGIRFLRYAHALFKGLLVLFLLVVIVNQFILTGFRVEGHSMDTTLHNGQLLPVFEANYWFTTPKLGDVVIVQYAGDANTRFVKRVMGVPGQTVLVGGDPVVLSSTQYYVLGDNRDHSTDSRVFGPVERSQILGKVLGVAAYHP